MKHSPLTRRVFLLSIVKEIYVYLHIDTFIKIKIVVDIIFLGYIMIIN